MATQTAAPQSRGFGWLKTLGLLAILVIGISIIIKMIGGFSFGSSNSSDDWQPVAQVTCKPVWNERGGWCDLSEVPKGTYRVVPQFEVWQMKLMPSNPPQASDQTYMSIPPEGRDISLWPDREFQQRFVNSAPVKSRRYGSLIVRVGPQSFEALSGNQPREFEVTKPTKISLNVNLPPQFLNYDGNQGELAVELQKRSE